MDVLLLFVGLLIDPLNFASEGRNGIGGHHFVVIGHLAL